MANLASILGGMMATGMAGRSQRGPSFASSPLDMLTGSAAPQARARSGGGFKQTAGMAALGYLAYKAYKDYQGNKAPSRQSGRMDEAASGGSLGERLAGMLRPEQRAAPEAALGDQKALLLIRAMISAAAADGEIDEEERRRILASLEQAGADEEDRRFLERELASPQPVNSLLRDVADEETAEQVYLASAMAIDADTPAEQAYLRNLAGSLNIDPGRLGGPGGTA